MKETNKNYREAKKGEVGNPLAYQHVQVLLALNMLFIITSTILAMVGYPEYFIISLFTTFLIIGYAVSPLGCRIVIWDDKSD